MKKILLIIALFTPITCNADTLWSDFSVSLLKGNDYEVGDNSKTIVTFEHAAGLSWGDSFFFVDRLESENGHLETYGEFSPRIELTTYQNSLMKNIYLASTVEFGNNFTNYLLGVGTNLKLPHFNFFKVNFYQRNNDLSDNSQQITVSWGVPIAALYYDGFIDYVFSSDDKSTSMNYTSQLKYDLAPHLNIKNKLYLGVEYVFWQNKFGIDGIDEKNINLLIKYHF